MKKKLIAGNWKMNGSLAANEALVKGLLAGLGTPACDVAVAVPSPYLAQVQGLLSGASIALGAQDVSAFASGAYTGEVSAAMLKDFGVRYALVGHSERRQYHGETDAVGCRKSPPGRWHPASRPSCVWARLCKSVRLVRRSLLVKRQLAAVIHVNGHCISEIVVAYEPVWAIGTGRTASPEQAQQVHAVLRAQLTAATPHADRVRAALRRQHERGECCRIACSARH